MKPEYILIRYGEIGLKGRVTRKQFEKTLRKNIRNALKKHNIHHEISIIQGRILLNTTMIEQSTTLLTHIFGVVSVSPAYKTSSQLDQISTLAFQLIDKQSREEQSFALRVTRSGNHPYTSQDAAIQVGSYIQSKKNLPVDLTNPDIEIFIEIRDDQAYIYFEKISGPGGMPMGTQGHVASLLDSKEDLLASWYLLKRGCRVSYLCSNKKILPVADDFFSTWHVPSYIIHLDAKKDILMQIKTIVSTSDFMALCDGSTLSNTPKTTIESIQSLKQEVKLPVLSPLITFNKNKIQALLEQKGIL